MKLKQVEKQISELLKDLELKGLKEFKGYVNEFFEIITEYLEDFIPLDEMEGIDGAIYYATDEIYDEIWINLNSVSVWDATETQLKMIKSLKFKKAINDLIEFKLTEIYKGAK